MSYSVIDIGSKINNSYYFLMSKFSSQEIESQYNLIKKILSDPEKYKDAINAIKKSIAYMPLELKKKTCRRKYYYINSEYISLNINQSYWDWIKVLQN